VEVKDVIWDFGDGEKAKGDRVGHNFQQRGVFQVKVVVHSQSGAVAQLSKVVRVVETLKLPDLAFDGTPEFGRGQDELRGEVPVSVNLTPRTTLPLVSFTCNLSPSRDLHTHAHCAGSGWEGSAQTHHSYCGTSGIQCLHSHDSRAGSGTAHRSVRCIGDCDPR
jgi:hypothetical protein